MANVQDYVDKIMSARYGEEVRGSIANAITAMNTESSTAYSTAVTAQDSAQRNAQAAERSAIEASNAQALSQASANASKESEDNSRVSEVNALSTLSTVQGLEATSRTYRDRCIEAETNASASESACAIYSDTASKAIDRAQKSADNANTSAISAQQSSASAQTSANQSLDARNQSEQFRNEAESFAAAAQAVAGISLATSTTPGIVRPDNNTIKVDNYGTLRAANDFTSADTKDPIEYRDFEKIENNEIATSFNNKMSVVAQNVRYQEKFRHWHDNKDVLDELTDSNGVLLYNGEKIAGEIPIASATTLGGVKIGAGINISDGVISSNMSTISDEWNNATVYEVGDYCIHDNVLYKCLVRNTGSEPTVGNSNWEKCSVGAELSQINSNFSANKSSTSITSNGVTMTFAREGIFLKLSTTGRATATVTNTLAGTLPDNLKPTSDVSSLIFQGNVTIRRSGDVYISCTNNVFTSGGNVLIAYL